MIFTYTLVSRSCVNHCQVSHVVLISSECVINLFAEFPTIYQNTCTCEKRLARGAHKSTSGWFVGQRACATIAGTVHWLDYNFRAAVWVTSNRYGFTLWKLIWQSIVSLFGSKNNWSDWTRKNCQQVFKKIYKNRLEIDVTVLQTPFYNSDVINITQS